MMDPMPGHPIVAATLDFAMYGLRRVRDHVIPDARGVVLELGVGTGLNFGRYREVDKLIGVEPDPHMLARAKRRLEKVELNAELLADSAEALPLEDASVDCVVATFVLCTIPDPAAALAEAHRVLKPGGQLLFAEHIRSFGAPEAWMQDRLDGIWGCFAGGCHVNRRTLDFIEQAGFHGMSWRPHGRQRATIAPVVSGWAER